MQNKDIFTYSLILIPLLMLGFFFQGINKNNSLDNCRLPSYIY